MKWALNWLAAVAVFAALPAPALANRVNDLELSMTEREAVIQLRSERPLRQPRMRFDRGGVRAWFPEVEEDTRLEVKGDGSAISRLRLRPGASGTALLRIDLGDRRRLSPQDVTIEPHQGGAMLRISRSALATVKPPVVPTAGRAPARRATPVAPAAKQEPAGGVGSTQPVAAARAPAASTTPVGAAAARQPGPSAGAGKVARRATALPLTSVARADDGTGEGAAADAEESAPSPQADSDPTVTLLAVTAVLATIYGLVRVFGRRRARHFADASIDVIGSRRLGPRHQLVLVRALGEDHLLSMNGDRTECIASGPSPGSQAASLRLLPPPSTSAPPSLMRALDEAAEGPAAPCDSERPRETPFGAELLGFMSRRANPSWQPDGQQGREPGESPAVAGLMRLRGRAAG